MSDGDLQHNTIFSYEEACALLPWVRQVTEDAHRDVDALQVAVDGGRLRPAAAQVQVDEVVGRWARALVEKGLEVKGAWLVDFDNGSGYYCWQYPEPALDYYHSYEDGFRGRMRIQ